MPTDDSQGHVERLLVLVPHYVIGAVWCIDILAVIGLTTTYRDAERAISQMARLAAPFRFPDFAVGFLLVLVGVIVPYAVARALNPLGDILMNLLIERFNFFAGGRHPLALEHFTAARARAKEMFGVPLPKDGWDEFLLHYLKHIDSPLARDFDRWDAANHERARLIFPVSLLVGLIVYAVVGQSWIALLIAVALSLAVAALLVHRANTILQMWGQQAALAFLLVTGDSTKAAKNAHASKPDDSSPSDGQV